MSTSELSALNAALNAWRRRLFSSGRISEFEWQEAYYRHRREVMQP
jgi:hypothetical protein